MPTTINLSTLTLAQGFKITSGANEYIGVAGFSSAGDINNDGIDDLVIGDFSRNTSAGGAYVLYGRSSNFGGNVSLTGLSSSAGFLFSGIGNNQRLGLSVAGIGDVNNDGIDDFAVGGDNNTGGTGEVYVIFGKMGGYTNFDTNAVNAATGARIIGAAGGDYAQIVSSAGDFNNDGIDDFLIGAPANDANGNNSGSVYIVYGQAGFTGFNLASLGSRGVQIIGAAGGSPDGDRLGRVSAAGDFNGDGKDDIIIGAPQTDATGADAGSAYVVFGRNTPPGTINLSTFSATDGLVIRGDAAGHFTGISVSTAGDFNGDGLTDIIVNGDSSYGYPNGPANGAAYIVFGRSGGGTVNLAGISTTNGFKIVGAAHEGAGFKVSSAGDLNGDGFDDVLVSAAYSGATVRNGYAYYATGAAYVIYGKNTGIGTINLNNLASSDGFKLVGNVSDSRAGQQLASAGDLNHDGINDIIVSDGANAAYVIYGTAPANTVPSATNLSTGESYTEDTPLNLTNIVVVDPDGGDTITATLTLSNTAAGALSVATSGAVTSTYNAGTGLWRASGALADVNALLAAVTFNPAANFNAAFTVATSVSDGVAAAITGTKTFTGTAVNDAPTLTATATNPTYTENGAAVTLFSGVAASTGPADEAGQTFTQLKLTVTNVESGHDTLVLGGSSLVLTDGATGSFGGGTSIVSISGGTATVTVSYTGGIDFGSLQAVLGVAAYLYDGDNPSGNDRVVTITSLTDNGGGASTATLAVSSTVHITAVDDAGIAQDDAFATDEATAIGGGLSLFANNGSGVDSDIDSVLGVTAINGVAASVGSQIMLASGALLTVNADGTFAYDPNHAFDTLTAVTGATNSAGTDSFTYTLTNSDTATVTIAIAGLGNSAALGTAGDDTLVGTSGDDRIFGYGGADTIDGGIGEDKIFVGGDPSRIDGGADDDGLYVLGGSDVTIGNAAITSIEHVYVAEGASVDLTGVGPGIASIYSRSDAGGGATIHGSDADDLIVGGAGADVLDGGIGDDRIRVLVQPATVDGGDGTNDILILRGPASFAFDDSSLTGIERIIVREATLDLTGVGDGLVIRASGNAGVSVTGTDGADRILGDDGDDTIDGGGSADVLVGGGGADTFAFSSLADTAGTGGAIDRILDFSHADTDTIDLSAIDADPGQNGQQGFTFIDRDAFSGGPGYEVRILDMRNGNATIQFDTDHDGIADHSILVHADIPLTAADFNI